MISALERGLLYQVQTFCQIRFQNSFFEILLKILENFRGIFGIFSSIFL